jgi:hypothetical protein
MGGSEYARYTDEQLGDAFKIVVEGLRQYTDELEEQKQLPNDARDEEQVRKEIVTNQLP